MKTYEFNRKDFNYAEEYFELIKQKMNLPDWFGKNADALWDMLTGYIKTPCKIVLIGFGDKDNAYNKYVIEQINTCFEDASKQFPDRFLIEYK